MKPNWDFWKNKEMSYDQRNKLGAGDNYGIGEGPKTGTMRDSYMDQAEGKLFKKQLAKKPDGSPRKLA